MLDFITIEKIATKAARARIPDAGLERVLIQSAVDSEGNDALRVIVVLKPETARTLSGDAALDLLVSVQQELSSQQEERFPIVEYATEAELEADKQETDAEANE